ncbi:MAG TPA: thioesterase family protein [Thermoanaerobaculia bacterium]|nr:thioesterase family protein [Thermoanaerobaculia bacterium]
MMVDASAVGLRHSLTIRVDDSLTVPRVSPAFGFHDMPPVFATAYLVGFVEATCIDALKPHLADGEKTLGVHVDLSHSAATPVGMHVTAEVELVAVDGRRVRFKVGCRDDVDVICTGFHDRYVIDAAKFVDRVKRKQARVSA